MSESKSSPVVDLQRSRDAETVRAYLLQYCCDRLGRPAPVVSRALAHDALDRLAKGA